MRTLGIIPARAGSKRVPNKNIRQLNGKPLIQYTIDAAKSSNLLDRFIVSTDCASIKAICKELEADVPFIRPAELAEDDTPDRPVLIHAINWYQSETGKLPDAIALLRPTSPFKTAQMIDKAIDLLEESTADSVRTMTKAEGVNHPYWMFKKGEKDKAEALDPDHTIDKYYQSQLLPPVYRLNGVVDVIRTDIVLDESHAMYGNDMRILEIEEAEAMDIDTEFDFRICEQLMQQR